MWFDRVMQLFIRLVLRHGTGEQGLFGRSDGYFGSVEAQGRGSLHCHMLLWLRGNLSPQDVRDRMKSDPAFQERMFGWLESVVKCELPGMASVLKEQPGEELKNPAKYNEDGNPALDLPPRIPNPETMSAVEREQFEEQFQGFVHDLACVYNWHRHRYTCWKHLKPGQAKIDANCRMRITGKTQPFTEIDEETGSILLRRLHPWINNFNDVVLFLLQSNMDIKYIGSGAAAKALVYYITDYITKGTLPMHLGLSAVIASIRKTEGLYGPGDDPVEATAKRRGFLIKCVNAMMGRLELSHQQVMSYIVGGGDFYCSHQFSALYWGDMSKVHPGPVLTDVLDEDERIVGGVEVALNIDNKDVVPSSFLYDYRFRPRDHGYEELSVWEYASLVEKMRDRSIDDDDGELADDPMGGERAGTRQSAHPKLKFLDGHPQQDTHVVKTRTKAHIPVLSGPHIPRPDVDDAARERFSRAMLLLFKPWRESNDLLQDFRCWRDAFEAHDFPPHLQRTIRNIHIESECKDAKQEYSRAQREGRLQEPMLPGAPAPFLGLSVVDQHAFDLAMMHEQTSDSPNLVLPSLCDDDATLASATPDDAYLGRLSGVAAQSITSLQRAGILLSDQDIAAWLKSDRGRPVQTSFQVPELTGLKKHMAELKKLRRPAVPDPQISQYVSNGKARDLPPSVTVESFEDPSSAQDMRDDAGSNEESIESPKTPFDKVILESKMSQNPEQKLVMEILDKHHERDRIVGKQLLMYTAGIGGTGKSHVIKAVQKYLEHHDHEGWLLVTAPTGIAAVLIKGYTIHALTFIPIIAKGSTGHYGALNEARLKELTEIWRRVRYLIIDEISMVSAIQLAFISKRLKEARKGMPGADKPFGGVNVLAFGDFGQLEPVGSASLFHPSLTKKLKENIGMSDSGQYALHGAYLWRLFDTVVTLKQKVRQQDDPEYGELLARVRLGEATTCGPGGTVDGSDYDTIARRTIDSIRVSDPAALKGFKDAPIIVGDRVSRDALNVRIVHTKAVEAGYKPLFLCARDRQTGSRVPLSGQVARAALMLPANKVTSIGCLPYFPGMKVMITENLDMQHLTVNGAEGILRHVETKTGADGMVHAVCAFVEVEGAGNVHEDLPEDIVAIFPSPTTHKFYSAAAQQEISFSREQLPLLPAYVYTDYKSQGRSLDRVIVDIASVHKSQGIYVMLSRVKTLAGLAVLRTFSSSKFSKGPSDYYLKEFLRLDEQSVLTERRFRDRQGRDMVATD